MGFDLVEVVRTQRWLPGPAVIMDPHLLDLRRSRRGNGRVMERLEEYEEDVDAAEVGHLPCRHRHRIYVGGTVYGRPGEVGSSIRNLKDVYEAPDAGEHRHPLYSRRCTSMSMAITTPYYA